MIIVKLTGGMGNQMFQYAAGRRLSIKHKTTLKLDTTFLLDRTPRENFTYRDYDLDVFNIQENFATPLEVNRFFSNNLIDKIQRKCKLKNLIQQPNLHYYEKLLISPNNSYLTGSWQSEKYFKDIEQIIRNEFTLKFDFDNNTKKMVDKIQSSNAICLHVRRGDYISNLKTNKFHGTCDLSYYMKSIDKIVDEVSNPHFFIFSDDPDWCRNNLQINYPYTIVSNLYAGNKNEYHLKLMTLCKHHIISNSTFSWWGAWLNESPGKIVIAPKKWFNDPSIDTNAIIPKRWVRI